MEKNRKGKRNEQEKGKNKERWMTGGKRRNERKGKKGERHKRMK